MLYQCRLVILLSNKPGGAFAGKHKMVIILPDLQHIKVGLKEPTLVGEYFKLVLRMDLLSEKMRRHSLDKGNWKSIKQEISLWLLLYLAHTRIILRG